MSDFRMKVGANGMITYKYRCIYHDKSISFETNLLCEVGQKYQRVFMDHILKKVEEGFKYQTRELHSSPWVADFLVK